MSGLDPQSGQPPASAVEDLREEVKRLRAANVAAVESADATSRFLAHVSHELRTPMNSILGMTRLALATELTAEQREYLSVISDSTESLMTLVNDLLDQAKIDAGMLVIEEIPFRIHDLVEGSLRGVQIMADHKGLKLQYERHPDVPDLVAGDPTRLRQVLLNLVSNAAKFTETGGIVVTAEPSGNGNGIRFAVSDTGIGIPSDKLESVFEEFRQADESTTRRFGGTGLGLSISARLVSLMGGELGVASEVGVGSTFHFTLPLAAAAPSDPPTAAGTPGDTAVVWLTDRYSCSDELLEALRERRIVARVCDTVDTALTVLQESSDQPAAIVVALQSRALDVAWELGRESRGAPVVVITPGGQRGDGARCREIGIAAYLTGPLAPGDVADAIDAVVAGVPELVTRHWLNERRRSLRIVVADDSATNRTLLARMLEQRGHCPIAAADGTEVLDIIEGEHVDVVLLDLHMPELDGYDTATRIRAMAGDAATVPIIAVSGSVSEDGRDRCLEVGIDDFLAKPYRPEQLLAIVERLIP